MKIKNNKKTIGDCLRNNWNSINDSKGEKQKLRIDFQNNAGRLTEKDIEFYIKYMWNEKAEKKLKERRG